MCGELLVPVWVVVALCDGCVSSSDNPPLQYVANLTQNTFLIHRLHIGGMSHLNDAFHWQHHVALCLYLNAGNVAYVFAALLTMRQLVDMGFPPTSLHVLVDLNVPAAMVKAATIICGEGVCFVPSGRAILARRRRFEMLDYLWYCQPSFWTAYVLDIHDRFDDTKTMLSEMKAFTDTPSSMQYAIHTRTQSSGRVDAGQFGIRMSAIKQKRLNMQIIGTHYPCDLVEYGSDERLLDSVIVDYFPDDNVLNSTCRWGSSRIDSTTLESLLENCKALLGEKLVRSLCMNTQ